MAPKKAPRQDRATKILTYLADISVNGHPETAGRAMPPAQARQPNREVLILRLREAFGADLIGMAGPIAARLVGPGGSLLLPSGLVGALLVGAGVARALAWALDLPAIGVHHMEGHLLAPLMEDDPPAAPFVALNLQPVLEVTRAIGSVVLAVTLVALWWRHRHDVRDAVAGMAWAMLAVLLLEPSTLPWYYTWPLAVAGAFTWSRRTLAIIAGLSVWLMVVFMPTGSIGLYSLWNVALAVALGALALWLLKRGIGLRS